MEIFSEINDNYKNLALALGYFDGVHLGHRKVISAAVDFAKNYGLNSAVITFKEHPQVFLRGCAPAYILSGKKRFEKLRELRVDIVFELDFKKLVGFSGEEYINDFLVRNFKPKFISTGFNHYFGAGKSGTPELLEKFSKISEYDYYKAPPFIIDNEVVSSSLIRKYLSEGKIKQANKFLGYNFSVDGIVKEGAKLASKIGFKTANLLYPEGIVKIPYGVYAVRANGLPAIANFGIKPTFDGLVAEPILEVHILNFDKNIYGENMSVEFVGFIRREIKFATVNELIKQIKLDIDLCKSMV